MNKITLAILILLSLAADQKAFAANPIIPGYADPAMRVANGKMFMVVGKDKSPELKTFNMPYWSIFSSSNLVDWKLECSIDPATTYLGAGNPRCWAADLTSRNGKWYFYFSNGGEETGVLRADDIAGPYVDVLKHGMVPGPHNYDPTAFTDDDGQKYLTFGRDGMLGAKLIHYQIARLSDDMLSLAGQSRDLLTTEPYGFGAAKVARDHSYFHKHDGIYYLSCAGVYMTSTNIYGPYTRPRQTGQNAGHTSFCEYNGQWYHAWEFTCEPFGVRTYRQVMLTYLHYKDNGDMVDDPYFLKGAGGYSCGVGNYDANWKQIEAEWFFNKSGAVKKESPAGGFEIQKIQNGDWLNFPAVKNLAANSQINFRVSSANASESEIEIHADSPGGALLGVCKVAGTGSWATYKTVACVLKNPAGTGNFFFVFKGGQGDLLHLDGFSFNSINRGGR